MVVSSSDRDRFTAAADSLGKLAWAIGGNAPTNSQTSFKWVIQRYPRRLSQLTTPIAVGQTDICGTAYTATFTARWLNPFWPTHLTTSGAIIAAGFTAQDDLGTFPDANLGYRNGTTGAFQASPSGIGFRTDGVISIRLVGVTQSDAQGLDLAVDGAVDNAAGTIRYSASDPTPVDYVIMVSGC